jgi:NADH-quinone oxidoreductase E subunit
MTFHPIMPYGEGHHRSDRVLLPKGEPFAYTKERAAELEEICSKYPPERRKSAVLAALYLVQEQAGYLTGIGLRHVAGILGLTPAEVEDVATYYVMFFKAPVGKYVLQVCRTLSCALGGAERVVEALSEKIGVKVGETDPSGMFTLLEFECLGACDRAPVVMVNNEHWHERLRPEDAGRLVDDLRSRGEAALSGCHLEVEKR